MIDIVYPITNLSKYRDDFELRYSLRSLQQQNWVRNVYLVGHKPKWTRNVKHIPCIDPYLSCKDVNIINKILRACINPELSETFVVNSDDQYILKPIDLQDLEPVLEHPNRLAEFKMRAAMNTWDKRVVDSVLWCSRNGYGDWIFQSHIPYIVNKEEYVSAMSKIPWGRGNGYTTHIYLNMTVVKHPEKEEKGRTLRIKTRVNLDEFNKAFNNAIFFNHNDSGFIPVVKKALEDHFPVKSRWEI